MKEDAVVRHAYVSTACQHASHSECRNHCKFCEAICLCHCHPWNGDRHFTHLAREGKA